MLIKWVDKIWFNVDGGDSLRYRLGKRDKIKYFVLSVYNQDGATILDMPDYFIHIQFVTKKNETRLIFLEYNKESNLILCHNFDVLNTIYNFTNKIVMNFLKNISNV